MEIKVTADSLYAEFLAAREARTPSKEQWAAKQLAKLSDDRMAAKIMRAERRAIEQAEAYAERLRAKRAATEAIIAAMRKS